MHTHDSNPASRIAPLDGLRGAAIMMVFLFHTSGGSHAPWWPVRLCAAFTRNGWTGVSLFFLLSGFLITGILWDSRERPRSKRHFVLRRALRILPLYYLSLIAALYAAARANLLLDALTHLWAPMLFLQDIPGAPTQCLHHFGPLPLFHLWSLAVEEQFYLLWPFLLLRQRDERQAGRLCLWITAGSTALRLAGIFFPGVGACLPLVLTRSAELALGSWIALVWRQGLPPRIRSSAPTIACGGATFFALAEAAGGRPEAALAIPAISAAFAAILVLALQEGAVARILSLRPLRSLGRLSYGIYLFHVLLAPVYDSVLRAAGVSSGVPFQLLRVPVYAIGSLAAAFAAHHLQELPAIRLGRRLTRSPGQPHQKPAGPSYSPSFLTSSV